MDLSLFIAPVVIQCKTKINKRTGLFSTKVTTLMEEHGNRANLYAVVFLGKTYKFENLASLGDANFWLQRQNDVSGRWLFLLGENTPNGSFTLEF